MTTSLLHLHLRIVRLGSTIIGTLGCLATSSKPTTLLGEVGHVLGWQH